MEENKSQKDLSGSLINGRYRLLEIIGKGGKLSKIILSCLVKLFKTTDRKERLTMAAKAEENLYAEYDAIVRVGKMYGAVNSSITRNLELCGQQHCQ